MLLQNRVDLINMIQTSVKALVWYKCVTVLHSQLRCVILTLTCLLKMLIFKLMIKC